MPGPLRAAAAADGRMLTTVERRNRQSELSALAGLHSVSALGPSFLRDSARTPDSLSERAVPRERWELGAAGDRGMPGGRENEDSRWSLEQGSSREQSPDLPEGERESVRQIVRGWVTERGVPDSPRSPVSSSQRNESPRLEWLGEIERERVRLVREWMHLASQQRDGISAAGGGGGGIGSGRREDGEREVDVGSSRDGSITDHEDGQPEHVRREFLRMRGRQARLELVMRMARERQLELQGISEHRAVSDFAHRHRIQSLLRGRFLRNGAPVEEERPPSMAARELGLLRQRHRVSGIREGFRFRLENIVRGQVNSHSETSASSNGSNIISPQLSTAMGSSDENYEQHQRRNVDTNTIEMEESQAEVAEGVTNTIAQQESTSQEGNSEDEEAHSVQQWQQDTDNTWHEGTVEESDGNWQESEDQVWPQETHGDEVEDSEDWHEDRSNLTVDNWQYEPSDPSRSEGPIPIGLATRFIPPDDESVYNMELRELVRRRSVSNLLRSGFRESLDQLIQSYIQRQGRSPIDWESPQSFLNPESQEEGQTEQDDASTTNQRDNVVGPQLGLPSPPPLPPQPVWTSEQRHMNWRRIRMHHSETENDVINDLRTDMARLYQEMNQMQRMLEACMDMQIELQRSVRQEVSAALNRSFDKTGSGEDILDDGSKWSHVRNGICCICCDNHVDSLLYRCGHMCTCLKCANELNRSGGKCPLCRAPIAEVIRAYSIL